MKKKVVPLLLCFVLLSAAVLAQTGVKKRRLLPYEYGRVIINNYSEKAGLAPVAFDHWLHRAKFTCRLCHVDIGFAMAAGATAIKAADNSSGYYCGSCHNGRTVVDGKKVFDSCAKTWKSEDKTTCTRCHSYGKNVRPVYDFNTFTHGLPKERFGNGIDWEKAEEEGLIKPIDFLEGISIKRKALAPQKDFEIGAKLAGMPDIIFSHKKHTVWNGCELCHPEIFVGVKRGATKYSMIAIFDGKYCGVCHSAVAFPLIDCQRCHTKPVS
jgi:c(7)-type cytochrome triheme protein